MYARFFDIQHRRLLLLVLTAILSFGLLQLSSPMLMQTAGFEGATPNAQTAQPYVLKTGKKHSGALTLDLQYMPGQNTIFVIEPQSSDWEHKGCVSKVSVIPTSEQGVAHESRVVKSAPFCKQVIVDFAPYLEKGLNRVILEIGSPLPKVEVYIHPQLFGAHLLSTLGCLGLFAAAAGLLFIVARRMGLDTATASIVVLGMAYCALPLHFRPNMEYTADLPGHVMYIQYMLDQWMHLYGYTGHENFHPPTYYFLAARIFGLFNEGPMNPLIAMRIIGLGLFMVFVLYGLRTLHEAIEKKGIAYYVGCVMMVFWPVSVYTASNINNDIIVYALSGAGFYYMTRYFRTRELSCWQWTIALLGIAFMMKSSALVLMGVIGACTLYALCSRKLAWRQLFYGRSLLVYAVFLLGLLVNFGRIIYMHLRHGDNQIMGYFGYPRNHDYPLAYYAHFDFQDFLQRPYGAFLSEHSFLNYFLKTLLYSPFNTPPFFANIPIALNFTLILWLVLIMVTTIMCIVRRARYADDVSPHIIGTVMSLAAVVGFTVVERYEHCQNFRYVFLMMIPLVTLFVSNMEMCRATVLSRPFRWLGLAASMVLVAGSIVLFVNKYAPLSI